MKIQKITLEAVLCFHDDEGLSGIMIKNGEPVFYRTKKAGFGKRCKDHSPFCFICLVWDAYDTLDEAIKYLWK